MDNLADGLLISNPDSRIEACNKAFASFVGCPAQDLTGKPLSQFIQFDQPETDSDTESGGTITDLANGNGKQDQLGPRVATIFNRSGLDLHMPVTHCPITNDHGQTIAYLTVVYIVQAHSIQQAQTEFVSTVSHELRTPLTSIKGFADTILRSGDRLDPAQQRRYVGIIKDQADRLTRLVEDLLAVSRLESKKMQLTIRAIDLPEAIERVLRNLADKIGSHRMIVDITPGLPPVWADADRLEQILTNLIDNAIKYSPDSTTVTIAVREQGKNGECIEFTVTDQGVGIPEDHLSKIFTKFGRLDNPLVRQTEGTGLGLYITRSLVLALGGQIQVKSKPGLTTFSIQLPAASLEEQAARGRG